MDAAAAIVAGLVALMAGSLIWARGRSDDETPPLFVTNCRCPVCDHPVYDHFVSKRLSGVFRGCDVGNCSCDVSITRIPPLH